MNDADPDWFSEETSTFGDRVAGAREAMGMTQDDLSRQLGVKLKTVRAWEYDMAEPRSNKLMSLSGVLNVSIMWLLNGEGDGLPGPVAESATATGLSEILAGMQEIRTRIAQNAEQLGTLERRLRAALKSEAE